MILFRDANPRWETDQIIFTKSNLEVLPSLANEDDPPEESTEGRAIEETLENGTSEQSNSAYAQGNQTEPVAIFAQEGQFQAGRAYKFRGWYKIERLTFLEPGSPELVRMLQQKFSMVDKEVS